MADGLLEGLNGLAGFAALVNSLLMWPTIRYLKRLEPRVEVLEEAQARSKLAMAASDARATVKREAGAVKRRMKRRG